MRSFPAGFGLFRGLFAGALGAGIWSVASLLRTAGTGVGATTAVWLGYLMDIGIAVAALGLGWYWLASPLLAWYTHS